MAVWVHSILHWAWQILKSARLICLAFPIQQCIALTDIVVEFWIDELLCTLAKVLQMKVFTKKDQIIIIIPTDILSHNYIVLFLT